MPKSIGLSGVAGNVPPFSLLRPNRNSLTLRVPRTWLSVIVRMYAEGWDTWPKPGMLLPCDAGSFDRMYSPPKKTPSELLERSLCRTSVVQRSMSTRAGDVPMNRPLPAASIMVARGMYGSRCSTKGSVTAARCASVGTRLLRLTSCRCLKPS